MTHILRHLLSRRLVLFGYRSCHHSVSDGAVRVRFAPSPTGQLHLGGLRTALYNFLFARSHGGKFILRIEDTDQSRVVPAAMDKLMEMLDWAGINVDEGPGTRGMYGPYIQSERLSLYKENIHTLVENGSAYRCFCTPRRLDLLRKDAARRGETPRYDNRCRYLHPDQVEEKLRNSEPYTVRFKLEAFTEPWEDLVYGPITYDVSTNEGDPILIKTDGYPTYHFANIVDDHLMGISHVLRGVEWQVSTPKHLLLYRAFSWQPPKFAHLPLILNRDGSKLSKRQNHIHVEYFKKMGYFPETVMSLMTAAGSGFRAPTGDVDMAQLIENFDLSLIKTNSTRLDLDRIPEYNRVHLKRKMADTSSRVELICSAQNLVKEYFGDELQRSDLQKEFLGEAYVTKVLDWAVQDRITMLEDLISPNFHFLWLVPTTFCLQNLPCPGRPVCDVLHATLAHLEGHDLEHLDPATITDGLKGVASDLGLKYGVYMRMLRSALSGLQDGPSIAEMMIVLGCDSTTQRLQAALTAVQQHSERLQT